MTLTPQKDYRVVIYGGHTKDWMSALGPDAHVWKLIPPVKKVLAIQANPLELPSKEDKYTDVIIPLLENHMQSVLKDFNCLIPSSKALEQFSNKKKFHESLLNSPSSQYLPQEYLHPYINTFPVFLKRTNLNAGNGIKLVSTLEELSESLLRPPFRGQEFIIQEFIPGNIEMVCHAVYKEGIRVWETSIQFTMEGSDEIRGPNSKFQMESVESDPALLAVFDQIMLTTRFSGPCNMNFKMSGSQIKIFEINPRLGGSLMRDTNVNQLAGALQAIINSLN